MAKKQQEHRLDNKLIQSLMNSIRGGLDNLYSNTYATTPLNRKDLDSLKKDIDTSMDNIINNNINSVGSPSISNLYSRLQMKNTEGKKGSNYDLEDMLNDKGLTDSIASAFMENNSIREYDQEIDICCKYMPDLEDALEAKKDNVLSADHFSKDFINVLNPSNVNEELSFHERIDELKSKYKLIELFEDIYDKTAKYGEQFVYIVPYSKALNRLLATKAANSTFGMYYANESVSLESINEGVIETEFNIKESVLNENTNIKGLSDNEMKELRDYVNSESYSNDNFTLKMNVTGILESAVKSYNSADKALSRIKKSSLYSTKINKTIDPEKLDLESPEVSSDGLISDSKEKHEVKIPGCIIKKIDRHNIIPIYIEQMCLGYYYLEYDFDEVFSKSALDPMIGLNAKAYNNAAGNQVDDRKDAMLRYISGQLSNAIDANFINNNQDLKEEIYMILKYNELNCKGKMTELKVTFIPPEDMIHSYFRKDEKSNRGISDLDKALLPAKLYSSLYTGNWTGIMTRGYDKRVYYVKNNVDTNIAKVLLNTINQIKKSNFGNREVSSAKNLLNLTGRFQDMIIPLGPSGDSPMNFEIMQGQNIEIKTELLDMLEQMAINSTDVPYDYIQSRKNVDYAVRLTMASGKFLRKVFKRQAIVEMIYSQIITKIYNTEFDESDKLEIELPPPGFLSLINTNQVIASTRENVDAIVEMEMAGESDELISIFRKKLMRHYLNGYLDTKNINTLKKQSEMEWNRDKEKKKNEEA